MLPSTDLDRDIKWYFEKLGFQLIRRSKAFAIIGRDDFCIHLDLSDESDREELIGGSTVKFFTDDVATFFNDFLATGVITADQFVQDENLGTKEIELQDLNGNTLIFIQGEI